MEMKALQDAEKKGETGKTGEADKTDKAGKTEDTAAEDRWRLFLNLSTLQPINHSHLTVALSHLLISRLS